MSMDEWGLVKEELVFQHDNDLRRMQQRLPRVILNRCIGLRLREHCYTGQRSRLT